MVGPQGFEPRIYNFHPEYSSDTQSEGCRLIHARLRTLRQCSLMSYGSILL